MNDLSAPHLWRSPLLSAPRSLELGPSRLQYFQRGSGRPIVFAHGWGTNANLWRNVVDRLAKRFCCYALDLPFGGHRMAFDATADLSPDDCGRIIGDALEALDLRDVVLVGNDSGGAYSQIAISQRPDRVARLVLNSCETPYDEFPPPPFQGLPIAGKNPAMLKQACMAMRDPAARSANGAYGLLVKHALPREVSDSYALPPTFSDDIVRDFAKVVSTACSGPVHAAGQKLIESFDKPVLFAWSSDDPVFPLANAHRYAAALKQAEVVVVRDSYSFVPEDQPRWLAEQIAAFASAS